MTIDLICQVVDNYGDIAVVWRLSQALVQDGPQDLEVRLLVDDLDAFHALNPNVQAGADVQLVPCRGGAVTVLRWSALNPLAVKSFRPAEAVVEAFGAPSPPAWLEEFYQAAAKAPPRILLHLEYLTAESWSEEYHLLPADLGHPGVRRRFFVPGFLPRTAGLVFTDPSAVPAARGSEDWLMTLFSYEHDFTRFWEELVTFLKARRQTACVYVFAGRSRNGALNSWRKVQEMRGPLSEIRVIDQPFISQDAYTSLMSAADFNVVRGEDSWVQAVLSGKPFLWQAYLQPEGHQKVKVNAFLEVWGRRFEAEGDLGSAVFERVAQEFRAINQRLENSESQAATEGYLVFWENRDLIEKVGRLWAAELRKNSKLSRKMLEFLEIVRV